jgi:hypothetical protein
MTGAAVNGHCCGPPGRLGLAWLLDTVAKLGVGPVAQIDNWADNGGVADQDPDGQEALFASWVYRPSA